MLNVFLTIDTEVYPLLPDWRETGLMSDMARDFQGQTFAGDFGVGYQLKVLNKYNLKAVYFVEALFASAVGLNPLRKIVDLINAQGQEVQLHLHPEWLKHIPDTTWGGRKYETIREFTEDNQARLIALGLRNLRECGASKVSAFRAGDYAANCDSLRALRRNDIIYDSSYNVCHLPVDFRIAADRMLLQPIRSEGVCEFPVSFFSDWPGHYRHAQVTACSYGELRNALVQAWKQNWFSFVIVFHSMELLMDRRRRIYRPRPDWAVIRRFLQLCEFLSEHRDKFKTSTFNELNLADIPTEEPSWGIVSNPLRTCGRIAEQGVRILRSRFLR